MKILLSNDDGVYAQGIQTLAKTLKTFADVYVVAPDRNRSGASNSLTLSAPLSVKQLDSDVLSVEGTPTDCVHLALTGLLPHNFDMVVSGINHGANLGDDVLYSGTVAAATEGRFLGLPAIAVSLASEQTTHMETAALVTKDIIQKLVNDPLPSSSILNVNVPDCAYSDLAGVEVCRLGTRHKSEPTIKTQDPRGNTIYWIGPPGSEQDAGLGTDFYAINHGRVAVTPIQVDLTHYKAFDQVSQWVEGFALESVAV